MRLPVLLVLFAACAGVPRSDYVPGGADLPASAKAEYRRALDQERRGHLDQALRVLDDLVSRYPLRLSLHVRRLELARRHRGVEYAASLYDPPPPGVGAPRADILARLVRLPDDDVVARKELLESATAREPSEPFWRLGLADVELTAHELIVARAEKERELGRVRVAEETMEEAARVLERARQEAETALQYDHGYMEAQLMLGYVASRRSDLGGDIDERDRWRNVAAYHYGEALKLDPASVAGRINMAENNLYFDRYTEATKQLKIASRLAPGEPLVWNNLGYTYYATGRVEKAIACYRKALELDPGRARTRAALADGLRRKGKIDEAMAELRRAREQAADDPVLLAEIAFKLAAIHEHAGRYAEAVKEYRRHIELGGKDARKAEWRIRSIYEGAYED